MFAVEHLPVNRPASGYNTQMKKSFISLAVLLLVAIVAADSAQIWLTGRSTLQWDATILLDPQRTGWNLIVANSLTQGTNLPANDVQRLSDTANTNGILRWVVISDPQTLLQTGLVKDLQWYNGTVFVSARNAAGEYSDWVALPGVYNPNPLNLRQK